MDLLKGGALIALIAGFWTNIKTSLWFVASIFIQRYEIKTEDLHNEIIGHLIQNNKKFNTYDKVFGSQYESFRTGKYGLVAFEKYGESMIVFLSEKKFFFNLFRIPFVFSKSGVETTTTETNTGAGAKDDKKIYSYIVSIRGTVDVAKIIEKAVGTRNSLSWELEDHAETTNRFNIYYFPERKQQDSDKRQKFGFGHSWYMLNNFDLIGVNQKELGLEMKSKGSALDNLYYPKEVENLIDIVRLWIKSKDWYKEKKIPWKKGWLLYGVPGTGKTALARAFAEDLDLPIYVFSLGQMSNNEFLKSWQSMQLNVPCIALMEDIDNVFHKRKNISQLSGMLNGSMFYQNGNSGEGSGEVKSPLTFDTLLNCLDGVDKTDGIFTIISTNDITKIDEALGIPEFLNLDKHNFISSRPGRIDSVIKLDYISNANKLKMANKILSEFPDKLEEVKLYISNNDVQETPAQFQEYCSQIALEEYWKVQSIYKSETDNDEEQSLIKIAN